MVNVKFVGGIGNCLFQYSAGRIIAQKLGLYFQCDWTGSALTNIADHLGLESKVGYGPQLPAPAMELPPEGQTLDWKKIEKFRGYLLVRGYLQDASIYDPHHDDILGWVSDSPNKNKFAGRRNIVLHVRLGDYKQRGWVAPIEYYMNAVHCELNFAGHVNVSEISIITDEPNNPFISELHNNLRGLNMPVFKDNMSEIDSFDTMRYASALICPCSTFSWWAGYIGTGRVYYPNPAKGFWSAKSDVNLRTVNPRFTPIDCQSTISLPSTDDGYIHTRRFK